MLQSQKQFIKNVCDAVNLGQLGASYLAVKKLPLYGGPPPNLTWASTRAVVSLVSWSLSSCTWQPATWADCCAWSNWLLTNCWLYCSSVWLNCNAVGTEVEPKESGTETVGKNLQETIIGTWAWHRTCNVWITSPPLYRPSHRDNFRRNTPKKVHLEWGSLVAALGLDPEAWAEWATEE